jgi:hypothetical protein
MSRWNGRLGALFAIALLVASCGQSTPSPRSSGSTTTAAPTATPQPPSDPTSEELIADALAAGKISYEDSILYRALALYDSPGLPDAYRSKVPDMEAAGPLFREIAGNESKLGAATLQKLAPYRARPADPVSIFNTAPVASARAGMALAAVGLSGLGGQFEAAPTAPAWESTSAAGGKVRIWVKASPDAVSQLTTFVADLDEVWGAYPGIFTYPRPDQANVPSNAANPDTAIDIYFVNVGALDPRRPECVKNPSLDSCRFSFSDNGYAQIAAPYVGARSSSGYMVIDAGRSGDNLIDTLAHELAHVAQFNYDDDEVSWLSESTATWVAYKVMKKLNLNPAYAYTQASSFYSGLDQPLTRETRQNAYGSWLYFLYASMEKSDGVVVDVWKAAAADGVQGADAVDKVLPFEKAFAGFGVRDWNQDPVKPKYDSVDSSFPDLQPHQRNTVDAIAGGQEDSLNANLPKLSTAYFDYSFDSSARAVTFENSLAGTPNAHVWAIKQIKDKWKPPEDWTGLDKKKFCRDAPEEDVTRLIIVVANSSMTDKLTSSQPPKIKGDAKGCVGWAGTMKGTYWWSGEGMTGTSTGTFSGVWVQDDSINANGCDPGECIRFIPEGTISWTWGATGHIGDKPCQQTTSGSLPAVDKFGLGDQQYLHLTIVDDTQHGYWGLGQYYLDKGVQDSIICYGFIGMTSNNHPPSFFNLDERSSSSNSDGGGGDTCYLGNWVIETQATTISGSCYSFKTPRNYHLLEWNLTRLGPPPGS